MRIKTRSGFPPLPTESVSDLQDNSNAEAGNP